MLVLPQIFHEKHYLLVISCKIFERSTSRIQHLSSLNSDPLHSKMAPLWCQNQLIRFPFGEAAPPLLSTGSSILDPDRLIFCTIYTCQLDEIHYLETRSCHVNTSFIILFVFYYSDNIIILSNKNMNYIQAVLIPFSKFLLIFINTSFMINVGTQQNFFSMKNQ